MTRKSSAHRWRTGARSCLIRIAFRGDRAGRFPRSTMAKGAIPDGPRSLVPMHRLRLHVHAATVPGVGSAFPGALRAGTQSNSRTRVYLLPKEGMYGNARSNERAVPPSRSLSEISPDSRPDGPQTLLPRRSCVDQRGDSAIIDPEGKFVAGPLHEKEGILYAEIDPRTLAGPRWMLDVAGRYARPDVFQLSVLREEKAMIGERPGKPARAATGHARTLPPARREKLPRGKPSARPKKK